MIAGGFAYWHEEEMDCSERANVCRIFDQLRSKDFEPLALIPHDVRQEYVGNGVQLIQQSLPYSEVVDFARCNETQQVCVSWSRLENHRELDLNSPIAPKSKHNNAAWILSNYQQWSTECPNFIEGDFVFAIHDPVSDHLFLARDRMGVKPLYYSEDPSCFLFASNLAAIARLDDVDNSPSVSWIAQYLYRHFIGNTSTAFENIKKLPAGHALILKKDKRGRPHEPKIWAYWTLADIASKPNEKRSSEEHVRRYKECFDAAVLKRVSDKHLTGVELSGGLDSSSIMSSLMKQIPSSDAHCFSREFFTLEKKPLEALRELYPKSYHHIWRTPEESNINYHQNLERYIKLFGLPDEHSLAIGCSDFLVTANECNVKTMLSGYGGDEFSSAFGHDVLVELADQRRFLSLFSRLNGPPTKRLKDAYRMFFRRHSKSMIRPKMLRLEHAELQYIDQHRRLFYENLANEKSHNRRMVKRWQQSGVQRLESHTLAGSGYGVSFNWPFLDETLLSCFFCTPIEERLGRGSNTRWLHRRAFRNSLPDVIVNKNDKDVGHLVGDSDSYDAFMQRFSNEMNLHPLLKSLVDETVLSQFFSNPNQEQREVFMYRYTYKSIYSINLWLKEYF